jgi:AraC family transcriptional regulator
MKHRMIDGVRLVDYCADTVMPAHAHEQLSFVIVVSGAYIERLRGRGDLEQQRGSVLLRPAGVPHSQRFGPAGARAMVITPDAEGLQHLASCGVGLQEPRQVRGPEFSSLAHRLLRELDRGDASTALGVRGLILQLIASFVRLATHSDSRAPPWVRAVRSLIRSESTQPHAVPTLARLVEKHPVHLAREFRRHYGTSVTEYRRQCRLARAESMLASELSLTSIAFSCGFASQSHFCRVFKHYYGVTASTYRLRIRRDADGCGIPRRG